MLFGCVDNATLIYINWRRTIRNEEHLLQVSIHRYLDLMKVFHFAVPNGSMRNIIVASKLKREGVKRGVSDLIIVLNGRCMFVEVKTPKGRLSKSQKEFKKSVEELGFEYLIWRSLDDAINFVNCLKK